MRLPKWPSRLKKKKKDLPIMQEHGFYHWVRKIPMKGRTTHSSIIVRRIPWTEVLGGLQSIASQGVRHN